MDMKRGGKTCCDPLYFIEHFVTFWACSSLLIKPPTPSLHVEYRLHVQTGGSLSVQAFPFLFIFPELRQELSPSKLNWNWNYRRETLKRIKRCTGGNFT